jgi:RNA polymerase sigma-70 factor (ECF subfamily)
MDGVQENEGETRPSDPSQWLVDRDESRIIARSESKTRRRGHIEIPASCPPTNTAHNENETLHRFSGGGMAAKLWRDWMFIPGWGRVRSDRTEDEHLARVYDELRQVATRLMRRERSDHTLSPTAVVHEAVIRLLRSPDFETADPSNLLASASRAMREVLIDHARRRAASRRGAGWRRVSLDSVVEYFEARDLDIVAVHEALDRLAVMNDRQSQVMTLRYFGGMTVPEIAKALGVSVVTVERDWRLARAWLRDQLKEAGPDDAGPLASD